MTRHFSKHERDDERPRSRHSSSGSYGEERSPRPARPRLNRNTVDQAWENGARQNHSDYRARDSRGGQSPRESGRRPHQSGQPSAYNGRNTNNSRSSYGNRSTDYRRSEHTPGRSHGPRPRSFESGMRRFDERQYNQRRNYQSREDNSDFRSREDSRYTSNRPPSRGYQRRDERPRRGYEQDSRPAHRSEYGDRPSRGFERQERQPRRFEDRGARPRQYAREQREHGTERERPDTRNARWQSRPQRSERTSREYEHPSHEREQFEGDYEQFDARDTFLDEVESHEIAQPDPGKRTARKSHRDTEIFTEANRQADSLIEHIVPVELAQDGTTGKAVPRAKKARTTRAGSTGAKAAAKTTRSRKTETKSRETHLRPSKKGFKWPTPAQAEQAEPSGEE